MDRVGITQLKTTSSYHVIGLGDMERCVNKIIMGNFTKGL